MNEPKELEWNRLFAYALPNPVKTRSTKCTCGHSSCKIAKGFVCRCSCKHLNHGIDQRRGMSALDEVLQLDGLTVTVTKEATGPLPSRPRIGDLALDLELSGRAELEGYA
jgi:hypothetical protein